MIRLLTVGSYALDHSRMRIATWLVFSVVLARAAGADVYKEGQTVAAKWRDRWYIATIDEKAGARYEISYGDGTDGTVDTADLLPMAETSALGVGDKVLAVRGSSQMFPGTIHAKEKKGFSIKWDDGTAASVVKVGKIAKLASAVSSDWEVGDRVAAKWGSDRWYLATIDVVTNGIYEVTYDDKSKGKVRAGDMREIARPRELAVGDKVIAVWSTGPRMYPGVIASTGSNGFSVKWDDGSAPSTLPANKIAKLGTATAKPTPAVVKTQVPTFVVGQRVAALVHGQYWFLGTVRSVDVAGDKYKVAYYAGSSVLEDTVGKAKLRAIATQDELSIGDLVVAVAPEGISVMRQGRIEKKSTKGYIVKWVDYDLSADIVLGNIARF